MHLLFNVTAILLFFPVPAMRRIPIVGAEWLAAQASRRKSVVFAYIVSVFIVLPLVGVVLLR